MQYPLEDLKILDFSRVLAGPFAGRMLSDLGADVLKIEPPEGDVTRLFGKKTGEQTGYYVQQNVGKRNVCMDLKAAGARELVLKLVAESDMVIENFRPGVMAKFGLAWQDLKAVNPKLVMLSISGFGQEGPEKSRAAYANVLHAETGIIARQAEAINGPMGDIQFSIADTYSSLHGLVGALSALHMANITGKGQHVDIAMINVMHGTDDFANYLLDGDWGSRQHQDVWQAPQDKHIIIAADAKFLWYTLSKRKGLRVEISANADIKTKIAIRQQAMQEHLLSFASFDDLTAMLDEVNLAWGRVRQAGEDAYDLPSVAARGIIVDVDNRAGGSRRTVQSPYRFSDASSGIATGAKAPHRGEHNSSALKDWINTQPDEVEQLQKAGVLLTE